MAGSHEEARGKRRDLTLVLSAASAIFAGLVGTNVLDIGNSARPMELADQAAIVLWLPALLLLALCTYKAPAPRPWQRRAAWGTTTVAGAVTAGVLLFTGFGFTRDTDHVRLWLTPQATSLVRSVCGVEGSGGGLYGTVSTRSLQQQFVIVDFTRKSQDPCTVDIPQSELREIQEHPPRQ